MLNIVHQDPAKMPTKRLLRRMDRLVEWPANATDALHNDPRCGCEGPEPCEWDSISAIEAELERRADA